MKNYEKYQSSYQSLVGVAYAYAIVSTIFTALFIIPLFWKIPMTIRIKRRRLADEPTNCLSLGICSLFFLTFVGGILLILANGEANQYDRAKISVTTDERTTKTESSVIASEVENNPLENNEVENTTTSFQI